jgi:hypothetical protein
LAGGINLYGYADANPINMTDPMGLFSDGLAAGGEYYGHSDFYGSNQFDFTIEDKGWSFPLFPWATWRHFRDLPDVENALANDLKNCNRASFERHMHQGQDYFVHYGRDFRWYSLGHIPDDLDFPTTGYQIKTDQRYNDWRDANRWSKPWVDKWNKKCRCGASGGW